MSFVCGGRHAAHGLKRTNRDKRNAIYKMLSDPLVSLNDDGIPWSDWDIARRCVVTITRSPPSAPRAFLSLGKFLVTSAPHDEARHHLHHVGVEHRRPSNSGTCGHSGAGCR